MKKKMESDGTARISNLNRSMDKLMLHSCSTSHITPDVTMVKDWISTSMLIKLAKDANMEGTAKGIRS